jgi:hypothetical protein
MQFRIQPSVAIIGRAALHRDAGGGIPGVEISGDILVEINSSGAAVTINTFATEAGSRKLKVVDGEFVLEDSVIQSGFYVGIEGKFIVAGVVEIEGSFELRFTPGPPIALTIGVAAHLRRSHALPRPKPLAQQSDGRQTAG